MEAHVGAAVQTMSQPGKDMLPRMLLHTVKPLFIIDLTDNPASLAEKGKHCVRILIPYLHIVINGLFLFLNIRYRKDGAFRIAGSIR